MLEHGDYEQSISVGGQERSFLVHYPKSAGKDAAPVMVVLHGRGIDAAQMAQLTGMDEVADREGFITVYPNGQEDEGGGRVWPWRVDSDGETRQTREVEFLDALMDELARLLPIDVHRVYFCGFSNGAILAYVLARELTSRIAAIATVAGFIGMKPFRLSHPISLIHIHGTRDRFVPYFGGTSARKGSSYIFPPFTEAVQHWLEAVGCASLRFEETIVDPLDPSMKIRTELYGPGWNGSEVELVTVEGGGHTWPGREQLVSYMGKSTNAFSASERIWKFLARHARGSERSP